MSKPSSSSPIRGFFIVLEGLDRSGKSTQAQLLLDHFASAGYPVQSWKFPDRTTPVGELIDRYLRKEVDLTGEDGRAIHLLFSANRWECSQRIEALLAAGTSVICDRYAFSGLAFSLAKGLKADYLISPDVGLPLPDLTLFLSLSEAATSQRGGFGDERYERTEFQALVKHQFRWVGEEIHRVHGAARWREIDASGTLEEVKVALWREVESLLLKGNTRGGVKGKLWVAEDAV